MSRLGYERYGAQGGDWGSMITAALAAQHPDRLVGIHLTLAVVVPPAETLCRHDPRRAGHARRLRALPDAGTAATRPSRPPGPQTLGYGLADSPMGQAAWVIEKFWSWTDHDGHPEDAIDRDHAARQRDALLADQHRHVVRPALLGELPRPRRRDR